MRRGKMQYRTDRYGNKISVLGFGCMRFTKKGSKIDFDKAEREIMAAYRRGVNYYDTAYVYPGSEALIGEIFEKNNIRDKINIATKLPHYLIRKKEDPDKFFEEELERLRTDHVDYYLMHMLTDVATWERLIGLGIKEWLDEKRKSGQIKQVGFSYHGGTEGFIKLIDAYDWDFCQIQYNYMDENAQAGVRGLKYAAAKGIPVVIMEPLRGGKLVNIPERAKKLLEKYPVKRSPADWAFRWLWNQPEVTCVLSGMNSVKMVKENCATASDAKVGELTERDMKLYKKVLAIINIKMKVGCTGCGYCMPCPKGVDIPGTFSSYNMCASEGYISSLRDHLMNTALRQNCTGALNCVECGRCEKHCPQHIEIRKELKNARKKLEGPIYRISSWVIRKFRLY